MPKLSFRRVKHALFPSDDVTMSWMEEVQQNVDIIGDLRIPRNAKNHRHMFAILNEAAHNIDGFADVDSLLEYLKLEAGMYKVRGHSTKKMADGSRIETQVITYESLNFESMDEVRFKRVKARFLWILHEKFGFEPSELEERALSQLAAYGAPDRRERR